MVETHAGIDTDPMMHASEDLTQIAEVVRLYVPSSNPPQSNRHW